MRFVTAFRTFQYNTVNVSFDQQCSTTESVKETLQGGKMDTAWMIWGLETIFHIRLLMMHVTKYADNRADTTAILNFTLRAVFVWQLSSMWQPAPGTIGSYWNMRLLEIWKTENAESAWFHRHKHASVLQRYIWIWCKEGWGCGGGGWRACVCLGVAWN